MLSARSDISLIDIGGNMGQEAVIAGKYGFSSVTFEVVALSVTTILFNLAAKQFCGALWSWQTYWYDDYR